MCCKHCINVLEVFKAYSQPPLTLNILKVSKTIFSNQSIILLNSIKVNHDFIIMWGQKLRVPRDKQYIETVATKLALNKLQILKHEPN